MQVELAIAGICFFLLALGHAIIGRRWVLPRLGEWTVPRTPFGSARLTRNGPLHLAFSRAPSDVRHRGDELDSLDVSSGGPP